MINATSAQSIAQTNRFLLKVHLTMLDSDNCTWVAKLLAKTARTRIEKCDVAVRGGHLRHNSSVESWSQILQTCLGQCRARLKITRPPTRGGATEPRPELRNVGRFFARLGYLSGEHLLDFMRKRERGHIMIVGSTRPLQCLKTWLMVCKYSTCFIDSNQQVEDHFVGLLFWHIIFLRWVLRHYYSIIGLQVTGHVHEEVRKVLYPLHNPCKIWQFLTNHNWLNQEKQPKVDVNTK